MESRTLSFAIRCDDEAFDWQTRKLRSEVRWFKGNGSVGGCHLYTLLERERQVFDDPAEAKVVFGVLQRTSARVSLVEVPGPVKPAPKIVEVKPPKAKPAAKDKDLMAVFDEVVQ